MSPSTAYRASAYYAALLVFGVTGLVVNAGCMLLAWLPGSARTERVMQQLIHGLFVFFVRLIGLLRLVQVEYRGFDRVPTCGAVIVANHPGLMDAPYLLARLPRGVCIFKPAIRRNPLFGSAAARAGYLGRDGRLGLIRAAAAKVRAGATLLVFPEGTRSPSRGRIGPFHRGFAVIARRAGVSVQLIRITCDVEMLTRACPWWKLPQLPARVIVQAGPCLNACAAASAAALAAEAEAWFRAPPPESCPGVANAALRTRNRSRPDEVSLPIPR